MDLVDLRVGRQDLVGELLRGGQHLRVVHGDQVLDQLLQLVPVHLEQRLRDGQAQLHLQGACARGRQNVSVFRYVRVYELWVCFAVVSDARLQWFILCTVQWKAKVRNTKSDGYFGVLSETGM